MTTSVQTNAPLSLETGARWIVLGTLFLIPLTPFIVADSFFFPFITGKAFYFRILVEIAFAAWVILAFLRKEYRPRLSWIGIAVVVLVGWQFIADAFAINAVKAYWSNFERMEGWVWLAHLLAFFVVMSTTLRATRTWRAWYLTWLSASLLVVGYALLQLGGSIQIHQGSTRIDATLGNSAYFAVYLLLNVFVAAWLALTEKRTWLRYTLMALAVLEGVLIFFTETRGTMIGLVVALGVAGILTAVTGGKRARGVAVGGLLILLVTVGSVYLARDSSFVQHNSILQRATSISLADGNVRFMLWHMAWQGFLERPLVGWGQEGYNYIFNTYYDPGLYHQEQWFDRAHSVFVDWLVAGGLPAFLAYCALFGSAVLLLWRTSSLSRPERIALTAALTGYAIHNVFVFDNLSSYISFFALLALIDSQVGRPIPWIDAKTETGSSDGVTYLLPIVTVLLVATIWVVNIPGIQAARGLTQALSSASYESILTSFQGLTNVHPAFAAQEIREQLASVASVLAQNQQLSREQRQQFALFTLGELQKQINAYPLDTRGVLQMAYVLRSYGAFEEARKYMKIAEQQSPAKIDLLLLEGMTAWEQGDMKAARDFFAHAYERAPQFPDLAVYAAAGAVITDDQKEADRLLALVDRASILNNPVLPSAYLQMKVWPRLIALYTDRTTLATASAQDWFSLASAYYSSGDTVGAVRVLHEAASRFPSTQADIDTVLKQISNGQ